MSNKDLTNYVTEMQNLCRYIIYSIGITPTNNLFQDLIQEANIGILKAIKAWESKERSQPLPPAAYLYPFIRSEVLAYLMRNAPSNPFGQAVHGIRRTIFWELLKNDKNIGSSDIEDLRKLLKTDTQTIVEVLRLLTSKVKSIP